MEPRIRERHVSPDGLLALIVLDEGGGDIAIGFEGGPWHVHADQLVGYYRVNEVDAVRQFVDDIVGSRVPITICRVNGVLESAWAVAWPAEIDVQTYSKNQPPEETLEFRYWNGTLWEPT